MPSIVACMASGKKPKRSGSECTLQKGAAHGHELVLGQVQHLAQEPPRPHMRMSWFWGKFRTLLRIPPPPPHMRMSWFWGRFRTLLRIPPPPPPHMRMSWFWGRFRTLLRAAACLCCGSVTGCNRGVRGASHHAGMGRAGAGRCMPIT